MFFSVILLFIQIFIHDTLIYSFQESLYTWKDRCEELEDKLTSRDLERLPNRSASEEVMLYSIPCFINFLFHYNLNLRVNNSDLSRLFLTLY